MNTSNFIPSWLNLYDILYGWANANAAGYFCVQLKSKHQIKNSVLYYLLSLNRMLKTFLLLKCDTKVLLFQNSKLFTS